MACNTKKYAIYLENPEKRKWRLLQNKPSQLAAYLIHSLFSAAVYGFVTYFFVFRLLSGESVLRAYIWNIVFIALLLVLDKLINETLLSKELVITKANYFFAMLVHILSFISFKTVLYLFYTFILVISRVSILEPDLFSESFRGFVLSIEYCLILVVAFDKFTEYLSKDTERIKRITAKFAKVTTFIASKGKKMRSARKRGKKPTK